MNYEKIFLAIVFPFAYIITAILLLKGVTEGLIIVMIIPTLAAIILILIEYKSLKELFKPFSHKISFKSLCFSIFFPIIIISLCSFLALVTYKGTLFEDWHYGLTAISKLILMSIALFILGSLEEYGWRAYLLPKFIKKHNMRSANLILGGIWVLYYLPTIIILNLHHGLEKSVLYIVLQIIAIFMLNYAFSYLYTLSQNIILPSIMYLLWTNLNIAVLGYPYKSTSYGFIVGNTQIINGECLFGVIFLSLFSVYAHVKLKIDK